MSHRRQQTAWGSIILILIAVWAVNSCSSRLGQAGDQLQNSANQIQQQVNAYQQRLNQQISHYQQQYQQYLNQCGKPCGGP